MSRLLQADHCHSGISLTVTAITNNMTLLITIKNETRQKRSPGCSPVSSAESITEGLWISKILSLSWMQQNEGTTCLCSTFWSTAYLLYSVKSSLDVLIYHTQDSQNYETPIPVDLESSHSIKQHRSLRHTPCMSLTKFLLNTIIEGIYWYQQTNKQNYQQIEIYPHTAILEN